MEISVPAVGLILWSLICIGLVVVWVLTIRDIFTGEFANHSERTVWLLIVLFAPFIGTLIYLAVGRKQKLNNF